ncbi:latent-transforming growth factor beta-binding protein 4 isoform X2 [Rhinatrema bivittatum]|uniref:latent-transforming growth factor beta-binding protein 4 isoform X2 n=1 Tax=Rhinatrema bivittatum TaxID=194408 RepID=UPI00112EDA6C|nr:latent-transforming growth factor beta-binding protein 4 isoform X2 [Rhinatrema bivittatum]
MVASWPLVLGLLFWTAVALSLQERRAGETAGSGPWAPGAPAASQRLPAAIKHRGAPPKPAGQKKAKAFKESSPNLCGDACCLGWSRAPKTGKCTKAICLPRCKNGGMCTKPQFCVCKPGHEGQRCEQVTASSKPSSHLLWPLLPGSSLDLPTPAFSSSLVKEGSPGDGAPLHALGLTSSAPTILPSDRRSPTPDRARTSGPSTKYDTAKKPSVTKKKAFSVHWQPLNLQELQSVLQRKSAGKLDKMAVLLSEHIKSKQNELSKEGLQWPGLSRKVLRTPRGEYTIERDSSPAAANQRARSEMVKVQFTPMVCKVHCLGDRCVNHCERGNRTTLYSGESPPPGNTAGFRVFLCPMLCQNGGLCIKKDKCLCPPNFTGKFCHLPVAPPQGSAAAVAALQANASAEQRSLTRSVYTLPLSNHQPEREGGASIVNVHVQHPPEASVKIHQVERVSGNEQWPVASGARREASRNGLQPEKPVLYSVQAQSSARVNGYTESSGFGYCFRQLNNGQCSSPLPGLRTQEVCCRGSGVAWGVHNCLPCAGYEGLAGHEGARDIQCPKGFESVNGSCVDINECLEAGLCQNGECTNIRGSYSCVCKAGYLLDASRSSCISQTVISEAKGPCYRILRDGGCSLPILRNITKQICCCSRVGKAWGRHCERCPAFGSEGFKEICPAGPGYHYSAADLRFNTRFLGQEQPKIPVGRPLELLPPVSTAQAVTPHLIVHGADPEERRPILRPELPAERSPIRPVIPEDRRPMRPVVPGDRRAVIPTTSPPSATERAAAPVPGTNVCELNPRICGPGRCVSRQGSYTCICNTGFRLSTQGTHCIDVDECRQTPHLCTNGRCENTVGGYRCACATGFHAGPQGTECTDIDECTGIQQPCTNGRCENTPGSFRCHCSPGFVLNPQGTGCTDVDECRQTPRRYCVNGRCENTAGSFRCVCPTGYKSNTQGTECYDVDECRQTPQPCRAGRCENSVGGYRCVCPAGFHLGPQDECVDINECENPSSCPGQECVNTAGAFQCRPCRAGYRLQNRKCSDIDECQTEAACGSEGRCINTDGSYQCECRPGYRLGSDRTRCSDINECLEGEFCFPRGECLNTEGSYTCHCAEGFRTSPDGTSCEDKDECHERVVCASGRCTNTEGSFECVCQTGYRASTDKSACQDIDECGEHGGSLCGAQHCENTLGSYKCITHCDAGYRAAASGDCTDVDECLEYGPALCGTQHCENTPGSYKCVTECEPGYRATASGTCTDINECLNSSICGEHTMCQNLIGSYQCVCDQGYEGARDGRQCVDVNECLTLQGVCGTALCENVEGSFLCICPSSAEEFDPMTGKCTRSTTAARPLFPSTSHADLSGLRECYYDLEDAQVCENILSRNVSWEQCCCSIGEGWGTNCQIQKCPALGSADYQSLCPGGTGYLISSEGYVDADECLLFGTQICKSGVCVNKVPGYACYCANGYYYDIHRLECIDNDECRDEEEACVGGRCINTVGSYYCTCDPPLILDESQRRCIANTSQTLDETLTFCWQSVGPDLVCTRPLLNRQTTYTECCCLYGEAWGMNCALCPARDSDDYEALCSALRPPAYGPNPYGPYEYGPEFQPGYNVPYGPDLFANRPPRVLRPGIIPGYETYPLGGGSTGYDGRSPSVYGSRDSLYSPPSYESPDFESDPSYAELREEESLIPYRQPDSDYDPRSPFPGSQYHPRNLPSSPGFGSRIRESRPLATLPERPRGPSEVYEERRYDQFEELQAEECGILNGCENGRCIRVPEGYTCDCHDGYRLDITQMACVDIDECREGEAPATVCVNGRCLNTDGSYQCVCPRGFQLSQQGNACSPTGPRG